MPTNANLDPHDVGSQEPLCADKCLRFHKPDCGCDLRLTSERRRAADPQAPVCVCDHCTCPCMRNEPDPPIAFVNGPGGRWTAVMDSFGHSDLEGVDRVPPRFHARYHEIIAKWEADFNAAHPIE